MKYVLLKLDDDKADKFLAKHANGPVLGVWEVPPKCKCAHSYQVERKNWEYDELLGRWVCLICTGTAVTVTTLAERLQIAFLSRNIISRYRRRRSK